MTIPYNNLPFSGESSGVPNGFLLTASCALAPVFAPAPVFALVLAPTLEVFVVVFDVFEALAKTVVDSFEEEPNGLGDFLLKQQKNKF